MKPGDKVYYIDKETGKKRFGIVASHEMEMYQPFTPKDAVWAYWNNNTEVTWMPRNLVFLYESKRRKLPNWF